MAAKILFCVTLLVVSAYGGVLNRLASFEGVPFETYGPPTVQNKAVFQIPAAAPLPLLPEGLPTLPAAQIIPVRQQEVVEVSAPYPAAVPFSTYGVPETVSENVFVPKAALVLPEGLPTLPAAPIIPVKQEVVEVSAPYPAAVPFSTYGVPETVSQNIFVPKAAPVLPEGLPTLPAAPIIPVQQKVVEVSAPYPAAVPFSTYGAPETVSQNIFVPKVAPVLPEGLPTLPAAPIIPVKQEVVEVSAPYPAALPFSTYGVPETVSENVFVPKAAPVLPEGLPTLPAAPIIPVQQKVVEVSAPYPAAVPFSTYGAPETVSQNIFVPKVAPVLPEGLPTLPAAPIIPVKQEVVEVSAPYPAALPFSTYGVPETVSENVFVPKAAPVLPEGLPTLPAAPIIPVKQEVVEVSAPYPAALPFSTYGVPETVSQNVFVPKAAPVLPEGLPTLPAAPIVPVQQKVVEVSAPYPAALPFSTYGVPETVSQNVFVPKVAPILPEGLPTLPAAPIVPVQQKVVEVSAPYPAALPASTYGVPTLPTEPFIVNRLTPTSFPYPAELPPSSYGQPLF